MDGGWFHVTWATFGSWLPGDPRGFRNHKHRIHSSGDYRNPPPKGEHAGLHAHARALMHRSMVELDEPQRIIARDAIVEKALAMGVRAECLAVCGRHVHLLCVLSRERINGEVGRLKRHSSHALRHAVPGAVWAARCLAKPVRGDEHFMELTRYIPTHLDNERAAIWSVRIGSRDP